MTSVLMNSLFSIRYLEPVCTFFLLGSQWKESAHRFKQPQNTNLTLVLRAHALELKKTHKGI